MTRRTRWFLIGSTLIAVSLFVSWPILSSSLSYHPELSRRGVWLVQNITEVKTVELNDVVDLDTYLDTNLDQSGKRNRFRVEQLRSRFPGIFIIGFGKAGTKALFEALKLNPHLVGPKREMRFFSDHYKIGLRRYLMLLPQPSPGVTIIEKSPDYVIDGPVPTRLKAAAYKLKIKPKNLKFVIVLRNPIDRAMSEYLEWNYNRRFKSQKSLPPFHWMVVHHNGSINDDQPFIKNYAKYILNWLKHFHKDQVCFVDGDRFVRDPYSEIHLLESCLDLGFYFTPEHFIYKPKTGFYCFKSSTSNETSALCMGANKGRKHPTIPAPIFNKLSDYFRPIDGQLIPLIGRVMEWQQTYGENIPQSQHHPQ